MSQTTFQHIATCAICTDSFSISRELIIADNTFIDCGHEGVDTRGNQNVVVRHNRFLDNVVGVIANDGSTIHIENNYFQNNRTAISVNNQGNPTIVGNEITTSTLYGIWLYTDSTATIIANNIYSNPTNLGLGKSTVDIIAENNWWGTSNVGSIQLSIYDGNDEAGLGFVDYDPFLLESLDLDVPK